METLRPVEVSEYYINRVASGLSKYFWDNIFSEIFTILKDNTVINSKDDVINAIKSGKIWYERGAFRTKDRFTNAVASTLEKMGAKYRNRAYYIPKTAIPFEYLQALGIQATQAAAKGNAIAKFLSGLTLSQVDLNFFIQSTVELMFKKLQLDILKSAQEKKIPVIELGIAQPDIKLPKAKTKPVEQYWKEHDKKAEKLREAIKKADKKGEDTAELKGQLQDLNRDAFENAPQLDIIIDDLKLDTKSRKIAEDYTYNMQYWVKKWETKNIVKMRQDVLQMVQEGARIERIAEYFEKRWKIAKNKALFLATQESHLAGSVIKATDYQAMGCESFRWLRSTSKEKRKLHETYYGRTFKFSEPPVIDEDLGITGLPRQIWNCKCQMSPVIPDVYTMMENKKEFNKKYGIFGKITNSKQNQWQYFRFGVRNERF